MTSTINATNVSATNDKPKGAGRGKKTARTLGIARSITMAEFLRNAKAVSMLVGMTAKSRHPHNAPVRDGMIGVSASGIITLETLSGPYARSASFPVSELESRLDYALELVEPRIGGGFAVAQDYDETEAANELAAALGIDLPTAKATNRVPAAVESDEESALDE